MTKLRIPQDVEWELLVVDNNSTDDTQEVAQSFTTRLPIRVLFEPTPGKSHALNHATNKAIGDYILWTDDDVLVDSEWLANYVEAFRRWPEAVLFGGLIDPWYLEEPPKWLKDGFWTVAGAYAARNLGSEPVQFNEAIGGPWGANMAVRTDAQRKYMYDVTLGPRPGSAVRGEETAVSQKMLSSGESGWWVPAARVKHLVPRERQTTSYLRGFYRGKGVFNRLRGQYASTQLPMMERIRLLYSCLQSEILYFFWRMMNKPSRWLMYLKRTSVVRGQLFGELEDVPR
jgi:glycosyltransferase involved in cell wall biosynthesis